MKITISHRDGVIEIEDGEMMIGCGQLVTVEGTIMGDGMRQVEWYLLLNELKDLLNRYPEADVDINLIKELR